MGLLLLWLCLWACGARAESSVWSLRFHSGPELGCDQPAQLLQAPAQHWQDTLAAARVAQPEFNAATRLWVELVAGPQPAVEPMLLVARGLRTARWYAWGADGSGLKQIQTETDTSSWGARHAPGFAVLRLDQPARPGTRLLACLDAGSRPIRATRSIEVMSEAALRASERQLELGLALALGAMLAMGLLGFAFYWRLRERAYGLYSAYVVAFMGYLLYVLDRLGELLPAAWLHEATVPAFGVALVGLTGLLGMLFALEFTRLKQTHPRLARTAMVLTYATCLGCLISIAGITLERPSLRHYGNLLVNLPMVTAISLLLPTFAWSAWRGSLQARYFVLGWTPLLGVVVWLALESVRGGFSLATLQLLVAGAALSSVVLGLGLADASGRLRQERDRALYAANHDGLTGASNRAAFMTRLKDSAVPCALLYCDLDHFKSVNDQHGHATGDTVLQQFVALARQQLRSHDVVGRLGGEEFAILLSSVSLPQAQSLAERLRATLGSTTMPSPNGPIYVTASFGLAMRQAGEKNEAWLSRADQALYRAKHGGRNRVVVAD